MNFKIDAFNLFKDEFEKQKIHCESLAKAKNKKSRQIFLINFFAPSIAELNFTNWVKLFDLGKITNSNIVYYPMTKPKNSKTTFTPLEWEIIKDRPEDCIIEVLHDEATWTEDEIETRVTQLYNLKAGDEIDLSDELTFAIIEDCIQGTFMDRMADEINNYGYSDRITQGQWSALVRASKSIERKTGVEFSYGLAAVSERGWCTHERPW